MFPLIPPKKAQETPASSPLECFFHQLFGTGVGCSQDTLIVGTFTDLSAKNLQDSRCRDVTGQF